MHKSLLLILTLVATSAMGLNSRSAVSINGNDANPCTTTQPCRSFGAAIPQTAAGGEVVALDSAGYGPFFIQQAVTVSGAPGVHAAITAVFDSAIDVSQPSNSGHVALRNLVLIGAGAGAGILADSVTEVSISNVTAIGFNVAGIFVSDGSTAVIDHCQLLNNVAGVEALNAKAIVTNSHIAGGSSGVLAEYNSSISVAHSVIGKNNVGVQCGPFSFNLGSTILVDDCSIAANDTGVLAGTDVGTALIFLSNDAIFANGTGVQANVGGAVGSYGNNRIDGNTVNLGPSTPLSTLTLR